MGGGGEKEFHSVSVSLWPYFNAKKIQLKLTRLLETVLALEKREGGRGDDEERAALVSR